MFEQRRRLVEMSHIIDFFYVLIQRENNPHSYLLRELFFIDASCVKVIYLIRKFATTESKGRTELSRVDGMW
jgi:membrane-bound acyltransferase YfiQ involved in biofilm formation